MILRNKAEGSASSSANAVWDDTSGAGTPPSETGAANAQGGEGAGSGGAGEGAEGQPAAAAPPAPKPVTAEDIAAAMKAVGIGAQPQAPAQPPQQMTQEDFDRTFNVMPVSQEMVTQILAGGEGALKAFALMRDGVAKQAVTMASFMIQDAFEKYKAQFEPEFTPIREHYRSEVERKGYEEFFTQQPDLKKAEHIVKMVVDQMKGEKYKADTKEAAFGELNKRVRAVIAKLPGINLNAEDGGGGEGQQPPAVPGKMPTLSRGGQGGTGKPSQGAGANKSPGHAVFG